MLVVSLSVAACSGSDADTLDDSLPSPPSTTADSAPSTVPDPDEAPLEALEELWDSMLNALASAPEERAELLDELGDRIPDEVEELAPVYFPHALTIESNATFVESDGDVGISDCAFTSEPTLLGSASAGFVATGRWDPAAKHWRLADFEYVKECVPVSLAEPALASVERYSDDMSVAWATLDDEHPVLTESMTEESRASALDGMETYRERGWIPVVDIERESFEVTGLVRQDGVLTVLISRCTHYGEGQGTFVATDDGPGARVEEFVPPVAIRAVLRMTLSEDDTMRFDGFGEVEDVDCLDAPTDLAARLL